VLGCESKRGQLRGGGAICLLMMMMEMVLVWLLLLLLMWLAVRMVMVAMVQCTWWATPQGLQRQRGRLTSPGQSHRYMTPLDP